MSQQEKEILGNMGDFIDRRRTLTLIKKTHEDLAVNYDPEKKKKKEIFRAVNRYM